MVSAYDQPIPSPYQASNYFQPIPDPLEDLLKTRPQTYTQVSAPASTGVYTADLRSFDLGSLLNRIQDDYVQNIRPFVASVQYVETNPALGGALTGIGPVTPGITRRGAFFLAELLVFTSYTMLSWRIPRAKRWRVPTSARFGSFGIRHEQWYSGVRAVVHQATIYSPPKTQKAISQSGYVTYQWARRMIETQIRSIRCIDILGSSNAATRRRPSDSKWMSWLQAR